MARMSWSELEDRRNARRYGKWAAAAIRSAIVMQAEVEMWRDPSNHSLEARSATERIQFWQARSDRHLADAVHYTILAAQSANRSMDGRKA